MAKESLKSQAYNTIKAKILNCEYAPNTFINEELLREEIAASRTPIRDAISRLEQEGLVKILPKKGIVVSDLSLNTINMVYETRYILEPYAILHYGNRITQETYMKYYDLYQHYLTGENLTYQYDDMDDTFHDMFIASTGNDYFIKMYDLIVNQVKRMRIMSGVSSEQRRKETIEEHLKIVECTMKQDWTGAANLMTVHLRNSKNAIFEVLFQKKDWSL